MNTAPLPARMADFSDEELIALRVALDREMKKRSLAYTVGEVGERLAIMHFNEKPGCPNLQLAPTGTKNVDALSRAGDRYSIKTVCRGKKTGTIYPDADDPEKQLFEYLLIVRLNSDWELDGIYQYAWDDFVTVRSWDKRMNAWYVATSKRALAASEVVFSVGSAG